MNRDNGQRGHPQPVTSSPDDAASITLEQGTQDRAAQEQGAEHEAKATPREGWQRMLAPKNGTAWMRRLAVSAAACLLFALLLFSAWHDRSGPDERRVVTATTQAAVAPETLLRQAQAAAQRQERRRQMALRARALAEKRAQQEARRRRQLAMGQLAMGQRASATLPRHAGGHPASASRFRTLSPSSSSATATGQAEPAGRSKDVASRDDLRQRLLADAIERQEQRMVPSEAMATSRETPLPRIARAPSAYAPIRAVLHPPPGLLLRAGTSIPATLITHISSEVAGPVQAVVNHAVYGFSGDNHNQRRPIIPAGTRLFGFNEGRASLGDRRLGIAW